jgi:hypothetical protein
MKRAAWVFASLAVSAALIGSPAVASAAEPEKIGNAFDATITGGPGGPQVEMTFALAHSDVSSYPVTITAIAGSVEEQLWDGTLSEGLYRFRAPLTKVRSGPIRLVLKTRMRNIDAGGNQSFHSYQRWDGTIGR